MKNLKDNQVRLIVFKSNTHIYAQVIENGFILTSASTAEKSFRSLPKRNNIEVAKEVGKRLSERLSKLNIGQVIFHRGKYRYHGKVKALVDEVIS